MAKHVHKIEIRPVKNGYNMTVHKTDSPNAPEYYHDTNKEETVHTSPKSVMNAVSKHLKSHAAKNNITAKASKDMNAVTQGEGSD